MEFFQFQKNNFFKIITSIAVRGTVEISKKSLKQKKKQKSKKINERFPETENY